VPAVELGGVSRQVGTPRQVEGADVNMKVVLCFLFVAGLATPALADRKTADECAASLPPAAKQIYETTMASNPTPQTGRSIVVGMSKR
jgi:hypothetical protein